MIAQCLPECWSMFVSILSTQEFAHSLGWLFALAMLTGLILDRDGRDLFRWAMAIWVFVTFDSLIRYHYLLEMGNRQPCYPVTFTITIAFLYTLGAILGWAIIYFAKKRVHMKYEEKEIQND